MDRAILHDISNELAIATGSVHAFLDGKLQPDTGRLQRVLGALESIAALLGELRATQQAPQAGRERLLQAIVEGSPYAKILVNNAGLITLVNAQAEEMFGYSREALLGQPIEMLVPARLRRGHPDLRDSFNEAPSARPMGAGRELFGRRSDGSEFPIEIGLNPIETDAGRLTLAAISDITERKRGEDLRLQHAGMQQHAAEVQQLNEELASASRFKSQFVATMSHELRTPLTAIIGSTELLARLPLEERAKHHAGTISEAAEALLALIGSVLDFSKIEAGKLDLRNEPFSIDTLVEGTADVVAQLAHEKGISFHTYVDPTIPALTGDADRLRQVLLNLLGNAVKFTDRGQIVARVFPVNIDADAALVRFEVQDTGIGIPADAVPGLFEPFVQGDTSASRKYAGSGLGLSISKRLIELMGGEIGIQTEPGAGSLFWFTGRFARDERTGIARSSLRDISGLIVSQDEAFAQIVRRYMDAWGMRTYHVTSLAEMTAALIAGKAPTWVSVVDNDAQGPEIADVIDAIHAREAARIVIVGGGALRKPLRQSYLYDAIASAADVQRETRAAPETRAPRAATGNPPTPVLVAEDNATLQELLALQFAELDVPAVFVSNGREALEAVRTGRYAMVFMDCQMPEMDGFTATKAIREAERVSGSHIPITAMTANAFAEDRDACLAAGMDDYLSKPVRLDTLRATLERWAPAVT